MSGLKEELKHEVDWRLDEIGILKTLPTKQKLSEKQKRVLQKYSIPSFYSLWEGFVTDGFSIYIRYLNQLNLSANKIRKSIIVNDIDVKYKLSDGRKNFNKKIDLVDNIFHYLNSQINIRTQLSTKSNLRFKVINEILERFNLELLPKVPFHIDLDKLVDIRNNISHGESIQALDWKLINRMSITTMNLIYEIFNRIIDGYETKSYLEDGIK